MNHRSYFTPYRLKLIIAPIIVAALLLILVAATKTDTLLIGQFIVNLSATLVFVGITALVLDYAANQEKQSQIKDAISLAESDIAATMSLINNSSARLYGYDLSVTVSKLNKDKYPKLSDALNAAVQTHVKQMTEEHDAKQLNINMYSDSLERYTNALNQIDTLISLYGFALTDKEKSGLLRVRRELKNITGYMSIFIDPSKKGNKDETVLGLKLTPKLGSSLKPMIVSLINTQNAAFPDKLK